MKPIIEYDPKKNMSVVDARPKILFSTSGSILVSVNSRRLSSHSYHLFSLIAENKNKGEKEEPASLSTATCCVLRPKGTFAPRICCQGHNQCL